MLRDDPPLPAPLEAIKRIFDRRFSAWDITLPAEDLAALRRGSIRQNGWAINYQFGQAEGASYLEYFASHRMTNDSLNRIYADGREELVDYCQEFFLADSEQAEQAYYQHNRRFYEEVKRRGFQL
jgi:hypothetical protein